MEQQAELTMRTDFEMSGIARPTPAKKTRCVSKELNVAFYSVKERSFTEWLTLNARSQNRGKKVTPSPLKY